jgi:hypothetical protein
MLMLAKTTFQRSGGGAAAVGHTGLTWRAAPTQSTEQSPTYTFTSQAIGTAAADRWVIVGVSSVSGALPSPTVGNVTVGGVNATNVVGAGSSGVQLWRALVPTGTTANIVVNDMGPGNNGCLIGYWTVNMATGIPVDTSESSAGGAVLTQTIDIPANGFAVGMSWFTIGTATDAAHTIDASFTEQAESFVNTSNAAFSHREIVGGAVSGISVTDTWVGDGVVGSCFASWA